MFSSPEDFVKYLERTQGELNIYEHELKPKLTDSELAISIYEMNPQLFIQMYGSAEEAKQKLETSIHAGDLAKIYYNPFLLTWARGKAEKLMGNQWDEVGDLLVAPVTIPSFNAAAVRSPEGFDVIIFNARLFMLLPMITDLLCDAQRDWTHMKWNNLYTLRANLELYIDAMLCPSDRGPLHERTYLTSDLASFRLGAASSQIQVLFILLHEFAHVTCGHLGTVQLDRDHPLDHGLEQGKYYTQSEEEEFEADKTAANWLFGCDPALIFDDEEIYLEAEDHPFLGLSLVNLFTILASLETRLNNASDTHPPAFDRVAGIARIIAEIPHHEDTERLMSEFLQFSKAFIGLHQSKSAGHNQSLELDAG